MGHEIILVCLKRCFFFFLMKSHRIKRMFSYCEPWSKSVNISDPRKFPSYKEGHAPTLSLMGHLVLALMLVVRLSQSRCAENNLLGISCTIHHIFRT